MRKPLFYATITKTFEHKKGGKDVYLSSEYLKQFDKDLYYKILLLESFEDQAWHTAAQISASCSAGCPQRVEIPERAV